MATTCKPPTAKLNGVKSNSSVKLPEVFFTSHVAVPPGGATMDRATRCVVRFKPVARICVKPLKDGATRRVWRGDIDRVVFRAVAAIDDQRKRHSGRRTERSKLSLPASPCILTTIGRCR